jgi:hypothetical protein
MRDYAKLVGLAKSSIDNGFSRAGKSLRGGDPADAALMLLAARVVAIGNALVLLAQNDLANEGLPMLRSLLELAACARWICGKDAEKRAELVLKELSDARWKSLWSETRIGELGLLKEDARLLDEACARHLRGNAQGLPWGHVFDGNKEPGFSADDLLRIAAVASGHVVKALDARWPGKFEGAEQLWEKAKQ